MRKFSKIFAVAITLCIMFGIVCTSAFADSITADKNLTVGSEYVTNVANIDFEESGAGGTTYASGKTSGMTNSKYGWAVARCSTIQTTLVESQVGLDGVTTNKYLRHRRLEGGGSTSQDAPYWEFFIGKYTTPTHVVDDYSYTVADYDFACDEYEYVLNGETCFGAEVPEGATDVKLNYPSTFNHYMIVRASNTAGKADLTTYLQIYIIYNADDGRYYASGNTKWDESDVVISDIAGAWNHITMVLETNKTNPSDSMLRYYCNGELVCEAKANTKNAEFLQLDSVRFNVSKDVVTSGEHYTFCIDNLACNYYAADYESGPDVYGLDDYYADPNHKSNKINNCEDIVYNGSYSYYGTPTPYSAILAHIDGTYEYSYNTKAALDLIKDGDFITLNRDLFDYVPAIDEIKEITFITESNSSFTLAEEAQEYYKLQNTGNRYTVRLASDDAMKLTWYNAQGDDREAIKVQKLLPMFVPSDAAPELNIYGKIDKSNASAPTIEILDRWEWDMDNDGISDGLGLSALSVSDINELREKGIEELSLVPIYTAKPLVFEMFTANEEGELEHFVPNNNYELLTTADGLIEAVAAIKAESEIFFVLGQSIDIPASIVVPESVVLNFNLNGKMITSTDVNIFTVRGNSTFNLYSAIPDGRVETNASAITTYKADTCTVNLGDFVDELEGASISGNNLTVVADKIVDLDAVNNTQTNNLKIYVNVNKGTYVASANAFVCATDVVYTINEANLFAGNAAFASLSNVASVKVTIDNSTVSATKFTTSWPDKGCLVNVTNSNISGFNNDANVTLGAYNKVQYINESVIDAKGANVPVAKEVLFAMANNNAIVEDIEIDGQTYTFSYNVLTFAAETEAPVFKDYVTVSWLDPAGEICDTTLWYPGSLAKKISISFEDEKLNNGWYNRRYNDWMNADAEKADSFEIVADADNVFKPVANDVVGDLSVSVSLQISEVFGYNVYLPAIPANEDVIEFNGFYIGSEKIINGVFENVVVDGNEGCIRLAGMIAAIELESDEITIKYTVNGKVLLKTIKIDVLDYVESVADTYECGSEECKIVFAMMNYKLESYIQATGNSNDVFTQAIKDFLNWHTGDCTCLDLDFNDVVSVVDYDAIKDIVEGFDYAMLLNSSNGYSSKFTFAIKLKNGADVSAVNAKIDDGSAEGVALVFESFVFDGYTEYRAVVDLADLNKVINLTITSGGVDLSASYDLAKHIELYNLDLHKALYVISSEAYAEEQEANG